MSQMIRLLNRLKISTKLNVVIAAAFIALCAMGILSVRTAQFQNDEGDRLHKESVRLLDVQMKVSTLLERAIGEVKSAPSELDIEQIRIKQADTAELINRAKACIRSGIEGNPKNYIIDSANDLIVAISNYEASIKDVFEFSLSFAQPQALEHLQTKVIPAQKQVRSAIDDFRSRADQSASEMEDQMDISTHMNTLFVISITIISALGFTVSAYFIIFRGISSPIIRLNQVMHNLAQGDRQIAVPSVDRSDELGEMARSIQFFKNNLIEVERLRLDQENQKLQADKDKRQSMVKLADTFESSVRQVVSGVSTAANQLQRTAQKMSLNADKTNRQCTVVAAAAEQASVNVQTVAAATEELTSSINEISRQVSESSRIGSAAVEEANRANATVNGLAEAAQKIGAVVNLINEIASQTNLLALNATIEAARAGDAGKGFAVVAGEVKNLANQTAKATEEIHAQVGHMQNVTGTTVDAIKSITGTIRRMSEISTTIASAVEEQGAATREIARNVTEASKGTQEVSSNISGVSQAAGETGRGANETLSAANSLGTQSENLSQEVERFITKVRQS
jgi:methyl-accepting chemotaxis protein